MVVSEKKVTAFRSYWSAKHADNSRRIGKPLVPASLELRESCVSFVNLPGRSKHFQEGLLVSELSPRVHRRPAQLSIWKVIGTSVLGSFHANALRAMAAMDSSRCMGR